MSIHEMSVAASVLIVAIVIIRAVGLYRLPKKMFLCLWGIATLRLLFPFSIPLPFSVPVEWAAPVSDFAANPGAYIPLDAIATPDGSETTIPVALMIWLVGICACALYFAISYFKSRKEFKTSLPVESEFTDRWLKDHPLRRPVQVRQTDRTKAPLTYGIFHPVILLPKRIDLTDETSLRYVLAHEYVHIRHLDVLTKLVLTVAVCVHWFNPLVWVMYILANRDIELICDETVVKSYEPEGKSTYALTLIKLEEIKGRVAIVNYFSKNFVEERIEAIMKYKKSSVLAIVLAIIVVGGAITAFASGYRTSDSSLPDGHNAQLLSADESYNQEDGPREVDSSLGTLFSVNRNDESKFTAEEWADILEKVEKGEILFFETLEEETAYFHNK